MTDLDQHVRGDLSHQRTLAILAIDLDAGRNPALVAGVAGYTRDNLLQLTQGTR